MSDGVDASVIVGLVNPGPGIDRLLAALDGQRGGVRFEVIVASRLTDGSTERLAAQHPRVTWLTAPAGTTLPELRTRALERSLGPVVLVTEDHTVPGPDWVAGLVIALREAPDEVAAVGGAVENGAQDRVTDRAAFLCEYSGYLPPRDPGGTKDLPGMNVAYRRDVLEQAGRETLAAGFWEATLHRRLLAEGRVFLQVPGVVIEHRKSFGFLEFATQRWHYSRWYAGTRFRPGAGARRGVYAILSLALPALVLLRVWRQAGRSPVHRRDRWVTLPALCCFAVCWALGEMVGYLCGPGRSLRRIE